MFKFFVEFDGLLAFVPSPDRVKMKILFINALDGGSFSEGSMHMHMPSHFPVIGFPQENLLPPSKPQVIVDRGTNGGNEGIRFLEWQDIEIRGGVERPRRLHIFEGRRPGSAEPHGSDERKDFSWLAEMGKIDPEIGEVDPLCLAPDPPRNKVISRLSLNYGEIFTDALAGAKSTEPFLWEFKTMDGKEISPLCQALASKVVWKTEVNGTYVTVRFWPFSASAPTEMIFVSHKGEDVKIGMRNLPLDTILGLNRIGYPDDSARLHFPLLAKVAKGQSRKAWVPSIVAQRTSPGGPVRGGSTLCIGGSLAG